MQIKAAHATQTHKHTHVSKLKVWKTLELDLHSVSILINRAIKSTMSKLDVYAELLHIEQGHITFEQWRLGESCGKLDHFEVDFSERVLCWLISNQY